MNTVAAASLTAWIQFTPNSSGYGIPLFSANTNHLLIPKTDHKLQIQTFEDFYNEDNFSVSNNLPRTHKGKFYRVNDVIPIPCFIDGKNIVINPADGISNLENQLGNQKNTQLGSHLREIVSNAAIHSNLRVFIGRRDEINKLVKIWDRVVSDAGTFHCVIVSGPPGVGKTALIAKFREVLTENRKIDVPSFRYFDGTDFLSFGRKPGPLSAAVEILSRFNSKATPTIRILPANQNLSRMDLRRIISQQRRTGGMLIVETDERLYLEKDLHLDNIWSIELEPFASGV